MKLNNKAIVLIKQKKSLSLCDINVPELSEGYVLVKMKYSGICHTQLNEISGILGKDKFLPHCIGHEGVGKVIKKGRNVESVKTGDLVGVSWVKSYEGIYTAGRWTMVLPGGSTQYNVDTDVNQSGSGADGSYPNN